MKEDKLVVKANELIESKYKLTTREQKIVLYLISKIKPSDGEFQIYKLPIKQFADMMGMKNVNYNEILDITEQLQQKILRIKVNKEGKKGEARVGWLSFAFHNQNEGTIDLRFDPFLKPYLLQLKNRFTSYELKNIVELKRSYSIRLYELLKQYEPIKERVIDLKEFREMLGIEDKYISYGNIKQKILIPAQKEIKEKTDIQFGFEGIKFGRKVERIKFIITPQLDKRLSNGKLTFFDVEEMSLHNRINRLANKYNFTVDLKIVERWEELAKKKWGEKDWETKLLFLVDDMSSNESTENPIGLITHLLKLKSSAGMDHGSNLDSYKLLKDVKSLFSMTQELLPQFLVRKKVTEQLMEKYSYSEEKASEYFEANLVEIMEYVERQAKNNMIRRR